MAAPLTAPPTAPLAPRQRLRIGAWGLACWVVLALVGLFQGQGWPPVTWLDSLAAGAGDTVWVSPDDEAMFRVLLTIEDVFSPSGITTMVVLLAIALLALGRGRLAIITVITPLVVGRLTSLLKVTYGRERPAWQNTDGFLESGSFPSGHASGTGALVALLALVVLVAVPSVLGRRVLLGVLAVIQVVVCLDRVLLGRHYPSDTVAGTLLGVGAVLVAVALYPPQGGTRRGETPTPGTQDEAGEPVAQGRPLAVVLNPVKVSDPDAFVEMVAGMAATRGWAPPRVYLTTVEDPGHGMTRAALRDGAELVLVCGGDGTVREVCATMAGTGVPVGIVPAGTGNLLARNLDIPLYRRPALECALGGETKAVDLVAVRGDGLEETHFLVMAGMGLDAAIMESVNEEFKARVGWLAYVFSGIKASMFPTIKLEISVDGGEFTTHRARMAVVGNVGYLTAGMPLLPDATIDDGRLDVVLLYPRGLLSWVPLAARVLLRQRHTDDLVNRMTGRTITLRSASAVPRQLDGDPCGEGRELEMTCLPGELLVRVPGERVTPWAVAAKVNARLTAGASTPS
ncbi:diacylglycerol kinase family protein [Nocardioides bruguierae]|uniref:Phosphatase PAP2 family protein n=1 Tax=Nocardioides bruguierae TaxID=2945102 RepID=A0A9X2D8G9_9ACTN|nr:diacylglycerol kinase family protein [Nocardioides bruguierae]MCM0621095.1 phosphatase PAP2 family protein [Nocardioides bruguierae]